MPAKIKINAHGPIRIEGDFELVDGAGNAFDLGGRTAISLCRCDKSENKPFCDGTHGRCGYQSEVVARALPPKK